MKFYDRQSELEELALLYRQASKAARMTVLTGRRRVGKTILALESAREQSCLYLFVSRKSEALLCAEYLDEIKRRFPVPVIGDIRTFKDVFALLVEVCRTQRLTVIIDEFQEFLSVNPAVYSEIQNLWDLNKASCKMNLILIGSVYSLMHRIFQDNKEPLFGRADRFMILKPFSIATLWEILSDAGVNSTGLLFDYYAFTGGLPTYVELLVTNKAFSHAKIVDFMLHQNSPFLQEGRHVLIEEFGKDHGTYFSILELIAAGRTARPQIESILEANVGGFFDRLEHDYAIVAKVKPFNAKPLSRLQRYRIVDNFLCFWFRFIYRNRSAVETGNFAYAKDILKRDYSTYCGRMLEWFYHDLFAATGNYNLIGSYWERDNQNEIDLVAVNDIKKTIVLADIKLDKARISLANLRKRSERLLAGYRRYQPEFIGLSLADIGKYLPNRKS